MPTAVEGSWDSGWLSFFSPNALPGVFPTPNCLFLPGNQIICSFAGCPLPRSPCLYPITTAGLFVSAFPCSRMPLCSPSGGGKAAFKTVRSVGRAEHRHALARSAVAGKVPRALNTGCCHLFCQAEEVLGKSHQPPEEQTWELLAQPLAVLPAAGRGDAPWKASARCVFNNSHEKAECYRTRGAVCTQVFLNRASVAFPSHLCCHLILAILISSSFLRWSCSLPTSVT